MTVPKPSWRHRRTNPSSSFWKQACVVLAVTCLSLWFFLSRSNHYHPRHIQQFLKKKHGALPHRVAILIPYADTHSVEPAYLDLFCTAARGSASLVDFLILHNGALQEYAFHNGVDNVKFVNLGSTREMAEMLMRVITTKMDSNTKQTLLHVLTQQITQYPYVLVEYKPALGHIFADYLKDYTHWGYSDLDIIMGDLPRFLTKDELTEYDIVTYGYGDQHRLYLRGQFTIHKNTDKVNQLWKGCEYLSDMPKRFEAFIHPTNEKPQFSLESAEGCYSAVILHQNDLNVKYAVKAMNDISKHDTANTHGVYLGFGVSKRKSIVYKHKPNENTAPIVQHNWFEQSVYHNVDTPLQQEVGTMQEIKMIKDKKEKCMYWAPAKYQDLICRDEDEIHATDTVFWIHGKLYKQPYQNLAFEQVETAPFFHFQEWKRHYRSTQLTSCRRDTTETCLLTQEGTIPILSQPSRKFPFPNNNMATSTNLAPWNYEKSYKKIHKDDLPTRRFCLFSKPKKHANPATSECTFGLTWQQVELLVSPDWNQVSVKRDVTLALTLQLSNAESFNLDLLESMMDILETNVRVWNKKPCVILIYMSGTTQASQDALLDRFENNVWNQCLVGVVFSKNDDIPSKKALTNMVRSVVPTRFVLIGLELERGLTLSREASLFCHERVELSNELQVVASVWLLPRFSVSTEEASQQDEIEELSISVSTIIKANRQLDENESQDDNVFVLGPDVLDCGFCEDNENDKRHIFGEMYDLWNELTRDQVTGQEIVTEKAGLARIALQYEQFQQTLMNLLAHDVQKINDMNESPILLIDNAGPIRGMNTMDLTYEVEEFGGMKCYNGLLLAQLATMGYTIEVLPGAFAASSEFSRRAACARLSTDGTPGTSRCDACHMFDDEHDFILQAVAENERRRPAKGALMWQASA